jgi:hypothetical protein
MSTVHSELIAHVTALADLPLAENRHELVAAAFAPLLAAAHELSQKMSAEQMAPVKPAVGFVSFQPGDS